MSAASWQIGDTHPDAPWTRNGVPLTCGVCGELSAQRLGVQSIVGPEHAYCPNHDPGERARVSLERKRKRAVVVKSWRVVESEFDGEKVYALAAPGARVVFQRGAPECVCRDKWCDHIAAHNAQYYNRAPTVDQARAIADAMNSAGASA